MKASNRKFRFDPPCQGSSTLVSETWRDVKEALIGVGCHSVQLDGLRVHLPMPFRERLRLWLNEVWFISLGVESHLRVVRKQLWLEYLEHLAHELARCGSARSIHPIISQSAVGITLDRGNRLSIPSTLASKVCLSDASNRVMLVPHEAWVEIWAARLWDDQVSQALGASVPSFPSSSPTVPSPSGDK
jgi:DNA-binding transcriptional regulator/RsmH inhibitor MraZ